MQSSIFLSSTLTVLVETVVVVPLTVKLPPTTTLSLKVLFPAAVCAPDKDR